jgi:hypothetical protein
MGWRPRGEEDKRFQGQAQDLALHGKMLIPVMSLGS